MLAAELPSSVPLGLRPYIDLHAAPLEVEFCLNGRCLHPNDVHLEGVSVANSHVRWVCARCVKEGGGCA